MRVVVVAVAVMLAAASPLSAQSFGPQPDAATQREILTLREQAWRSWFTNDTAGFARVVPDELIALGWDGGAWEDRAQTMAAMREFAATGMTLDELHFTRNVFQQYGDAVILLEAIRQGVPRSALVRIAANIAIDTAIGAFPVIGDLFDAAWKSNRRNLAILERRAAEPSRHVEGDRTVLYALGGLALALVGALVVGGAYLTVQLLQLLASR